MKESRLDQKLCPLVRGCELHLYFSKCEASQVIGRESLRLECL